MDQQSIVPPGDQPISGQPQQPNQSAAPSFFNAPEPAYEPTNAQPFEAPVQSQAEQADQQDQQDPQDQQFDDADEYEAALREQYYQEQLQQQQMQQSMIAPGMYRPIPEQLVIQWVAPSRPFKMRDRKFLTTILVIALLFGLILLFSQQYVAIAVVLAATFFFYALSVFPPQDLVHKITTFGIRIENEFYQWEEFGRFWFAQKFGQDVVHIELGRYPGRVSLLLGEIPMEDMRAILQEVLLEEKPEPTQLEKMAAWLQKKIPLDIE